MITLVIFIIVITEYKSDQIDSLTAPNPDGFFADLNDGACSVSVAVRVRPLVGKELSEGARKECVFPPEGDTNR